MGNNAQAIAAIGLHAQQLSIETIANNLTNMATPGFKSGRVRFQELMAPSAAGVLAGAVGRDFSAGKLTATASSLDVAIQGAGMLEVELPDGTAGYTRGGSLQVNAEGLLATAQGFALRPSMQVPRNVSELRIGADGKVSVLTPDSPIPLELGQLVLAGFTNPDGLKAVADGVYVPTERSGAAMQGRAGEDGLGALAQRSLEASNVNMVDQMTSLMAAQRAFEMASKVFTAGDDLERIANELRR
jgi:flagellar basal-body rod protein FlgG